MPNSSPAHARQHGAAFTIANTIALVILGSLLPAISHSAPLVPLQWELLPLPGFAFIGPSVTVDGVNRTLYLFSGSQDLQAPVQSSRMYRQDLDRPWVEWTPASSGGVPAPGLGHLFFDADRQRVLVLGGWSTAGSTSRIFSWDPPADAWEELVTAHPGPDTLWRLQPMVHDTRRDRLLFLGSGFDAETETWVLDLSAPEPDWSSLATTNPPPFTLQSGAAYDSLGDRVFVYGGQRLSGEIDELWSLDLSTGTWAIVLQGGYPGPIRSPRLVWDSAENRLVAHDPEGGLLDEGHRSIRTLALDAPPQWTLLPIAGEPVGTNPSRPWAYDPIAGEIHVEDSDRPFPLVATLGLRPSAIWTTRVLEDRCPLNHRAAGAADVTARDWYVHGGSNLYRIDLDDPSQQELVAPSGPPPPARFDHSAVWDSLGGRIVFYGGKSLPGDSLRDTWALELGPVPHWSEIVTDVLGPAHVGRPSALDAVRRHLYVVSGAELWRLDLAMDPATWSLITRLPTPVATAMTFDRVSRRLLVLDAGQGYAIEVEETPAVILPPVPVVSPASYSAYAYDSRRRQMMVHNGITGASNSGPFYRDRTDFFRASSEPVFVDPGVTNAGSTSRNSGIATYDPVRDRVLLMNGASGGLWALQFDESTPARLDLIETETVGNDVRLRFAGDGYSGVVRVERRTDDDWTEIGVAMEMSPGLYEFLDTDVAPGEAHRYRGRWFADGEERTTSESAPVLVGHADPAAITLRARDGAIVRSGPLVFSCRLPVDGIGVLELIDVRGRIVGHAAFSAQAGLGVEVTVDGPRAARAGLYFARLRQGDAAVTLRVVRL